ncbi:MAG: class I tRNA ligase family protein, partial [Chthoniobacterales bacterium]|nr:class I tRNA ligase family protein [Chthoniobacterales bacterium]
MRRQNSARPQQVASRANHWRRFLDVTLSRCNRRSRLHGWCAVAELSKTYDPGAVEPKWYQRWLERGDFHADATSSKPPFSIVIPPPNITGVLTLGHVLN